MKHRSAALITQENDWCVARCPELSVTSQGESVESAHSNLCEAIELCLETRGPSGGRPAEAPEFWTTVDVSR